MLITESTYPMSLVVLFRIFLLAGILMPLFAERLKLIAHVPRRLSLIQFKTDQSYEIWFCFNCDAFHTSKAK